MFTIFTIPKPFREETETRQLNAIQSWIQLKPPCEIILCGNDYGVDEVARDFKIKHVPDVSCNEFGTPLLNSAFDKVCAIAQYPILCYVNADIILFNDLIEATQRVRLPLFLMVGTRQDLDLDEKIDFADDEWPTALIKLAKDQGEEATDFFHDYFVFTPNKSLEKLSPFAVGRPRWDTWFVYHARKLGIPVIDASKAIMVVHQNHDYSHIPASTKPIVAHSEAQWEGPEAEINRKLSADSMGAVHQFTMLDATHVLTPNYLAPALELKYLKKRWHSLPVLNPKTAKFYRVGNRVLRALRSLNERIK